MIVPAAGLQVLDFFGIPGGGPAGGDVMMSTPRVRRVTTGIRVHVRPGDGPAERSPLRGQFLPLVPARGDEPVGTAAAVDESVRKRLGRMR
jgi:hypothetical protein